MRRDRSPGFEGLESRTLLSAAHPAVARAVPAVSTVVLAGTLAVDNKAAINTMDGQGGWTTTTPVAGTLGTLGKVRGYWIERVDSAGNALPPDTLRLRDPQGTFVLAFNTADPGKVRHLTGGTVSYEIPQRLHSGTGAYARASEGGSIELVSNTGKTNVGKMTLSTNNS